MLFCSVCNNMYYITINNETQDKLTYYCRCCGNKDENMTNNGVCVLNTQSKNNQLNYKHVINRYTKLDPTIPRINNLPCPNAVCKTNRTESENKKKVSNEILYIRYNDKDLKYVYMCCVCDSV